MRLTTIFWIWFVFIESLLLEICFGLVGVVDPNIFDSELLPMTDCYTCIYFARLVSMLTVIIGALEVLIMSRVDEEFQNLQLLLQAGLFVSDLLIIGTLGQAQTWVLKTIAMFTLAVFSLVMRLLYFGYVHWCVRAESELP